MFIRFESLQEYLDVDKSIVDHMDFITNNEYSRTGTIHYFNPEPEANEVDGAYYMPFYKRFEHLFTGLTIVENLPTNDSTIEGQQEV